jgi:hypothetical protein
MIAMQSLLQWTLDARCRELVRSCLDDEVEFVRKAAGATAAFHTMHASLNRDGRGELPAEMFPAMN